LTRARVRERAAGPDTLLPSSLKVDPPSVKIAVFERGTQYVRIHFALSAMAAVAVSCIGPAAHADDFACKLSDDGKTVEAMIANPYKIETSCQVDCQVSTTVADTTFQVSCTKSVSPGAGQVAICSRTYNKGRLIKVVGGEGNCVKPEAATEDTDSDDEAPPTANDPAKLREDIRKQLPPDAQKTFDQLNKP
jgi:hypothetical protein